MIEDDIENIGKPKETTKDKIMRIWKPKNQDAPEKLPSTVITDFPPRSINDQRVNVKKGELHLSTIRELSMSLVITGDPMGRSWTCTIISDVIDEKAVARYMEEIKDILQMFIHQQYTGRVLSFLLILGYLCESLSKECEDFTKELEDIMGMDVRTCPFFFVTL